MKKILAGCLSVVLLLGIGSAMHLGAPARWEGHAAIVHGLPSWDGGLITIFKLPGHKKDAQSLKAQAELEAKVDAEDAEYDRDKALREREIRRKKNEEASNLASYYGLDVGQTFVSYFNMISSKPAQPSFQPTTTPVTPVTPTTPTPTPTTPPATPTTTPSTPQQPKPSYPSSGNVSGALTDHYTYEASNGSWWTWRMQSDTYIWLDGSLDGVDAGSLNGTQLVLDVDGDSLTVAALALVDEQAGTYALQFHLSDAQYMALMDHFYQGGDRIPMELRSGAGLGLSGEPTVYLVMEQNGYSFKTGIYVS